MKQKQSFEPGATVKIGFMTFKVIGKAENKEYYRPNAYILESTKGVRYQFTPYYGLEKLE